MMMVTQADVSQSHQMPEKGYAINGTAEPKELQHSDSIHAQLMIFVGISLRMRLPSKLWFVLNTRSAVAIAFVSAENNPSRMQTSVIQEASNVPAEIIKNPAGKTIVVEWSETPAKAFVRMCKMGL
jgi:hypothetical protein